MTSPTNTPPLILASQSTGRVQLLQNAGLTFSALPADLDERALEQQLHERQQAATGQRARPEQVALALAEAKARFIAGAHPEALVIGADQVLALDNELFDKPRDLAQARARLLAFRGRAHRLVAAVSVVRSGQLLFSHTDQAVMQMRAFSDRFLDDYLARAGDSVLSSVGAYRLEETGVQLFERIDGDYFTILGLPLLPLLAFLRTQQVIMA